MERDLAIGLADGFLTSDSPTPRSITHVGAPPAAVAIPRTEQPEMAVHDAARQARLHNRNQWRWALQQDTFAARLSHRCLLSERAGMKAVSLLNGPPVAKNAAPC
jgi:hypothetical protein